MKGTRRTIVQPYYPYGYGYGYDPYLQELLYDRYRRREPEYVVMPPQEPKKTQLSIHLPTILASVGLSYLIWGRR